MRSRIRDFTFLLNALSAPGTWQGPLHTLSFNLPNSLTKLVVLSPTLWMRELSLKRSENLVYSSEVMAVEFNSRFACLTPRPDSLPHAETPPINRILFFPSFPHFFSSFFP